MFIVKTSVLKCFRKEKYEIHLFVSWKVLILASSPSCVFLMKHLYRFSLFMFFLAPSSPPVNITVGAHNSTAIYVAWLPVPKEHRNGIIIAYRLDLNSGSSHTPGKDIILTYGGEDEPQNVTFLGLHKFTEYTVRVTAKTSVGNSEASQGITVKTHQDGK